MAPQKGEDRVVSKIRSGDRNQARGSRKLQGGIMVLNDLQPFAARSIAIWWDPDVSDDNGWVIWRERLA